MPLATVLRSAAQGRFCAKRPHARVGTDFFVGSIVVGMGRQGWRRVAAVAAAYLLVLQAVLTGLALGAHADPAGRGALATVICSSAGPGGGDDQSGLPFEHSDWIACCVLGCGMSSLGLAPPLAGTGVARIPPAEAIALRWVPRAQPGRGFERSPRNTRAPPRAA